MISRIRRALKLLAAVERLEQRLKAVETPYSASISFDIETLDFRVEYGKRHVSGWPLASVIERL